MQARGSKLRTLALMAAMFQTSQMDGNLAPSILPKYDPEFRASRKTPLTKKQIKSRKRSKAAGIARAINR